MDKRRRVFVIGVGTTKFERPLTKNWDYHDMGREAGIYDIGNILVQ